MINVNGNKKDSIRIIKNFIKDLSFENTQHINENNDINNKNSDLNFHLDVFYKTYDNIKFFSLLLRYTLNCSSKDNKKKLFILELDYQGYFEILDEKKYDQEQLIKLGINLLFPFVKELVEDITLKGGIVPVSLSEVDFNLIKN